MQHSIKHLQSVDGEAWIGVLDAVYAVSMTLIAVELPELVRHIAVMPNNLMGDLMTAKVLLYLLVSYLATFLLFYDVWTVHKTILRLGGLKRQSQNILNGTIMALSCLAAGNVILIIKSRQELDTETLKMVSNARQLVLHWANAHWFMWITIFTIFAVMFNLMARLSSLGVDCSETNRAKLVQLGRSLDFKVKLILLGFFVWAPMLFGYKVFIEPIFMFLAFLVVCFFEEPIIAWWKRRGSHA